jgi:hypothetical protein
MFDPVTLVSVVGALDLAVPKLLGLYVTSACVMRVTSHHARQRSDHAGDAGADRTLCLGCLRPHYLRLCPVRGARHRRHHRVPRHRVPDGAQEGRERELARRRGGGEGEE